MHCIHTRLAVLASAASAAQATPLQHAPVPHRLPTLPIPPLQEFAGELLALAGPLDPSAIAFDPAAAFSSAAAPGPAAPGVAAGASGGGGRSQCREATPGSQGGKGGRAGSAGRARPASAGGGSGAAGGGTWAAALALLGDYLVDESVEVIRTAQYTLRLLLATPEGQEALGALDSGLRPYLEVFQHTGTGQAGASGAQPSAASPGALPGAPPELGSRQLWRCDARPYDQWVCDLACAMLRKVRRME